MYIAKLNQVVNNFNASLLKCNGKFKLKANLIIVI